jgi:hypothetical protein
VGRDPESVRPDVERALASQRFKGVAVVSPGPVGHEVVHDDRERMEGLLAGYRQPLPVVEVDVVEGPGAEAERDAVNHRRRRVICSAAFASYSDWRIRWLGSA